MAIPWERNEDREKEEGEPDEPIKRSRSDPSVHAGSDICLDAEIAIDVWRLEFIVSTLLVIVTLKSNY